MLNRLKAPKGAVKKIKRVGRGESSGWGKTSGKGHKGQKARSGKTVRPGFEGGQMPLQRRLPKRGFTSMTKTELNILNVGCLDEAFKAGETASTETLFERGLIKNRRRRLKVLGDGDIKKAITVKADMFSKSAKSKIEGAGGKAEAP
ncbi:MAG: 50S ribosomal protein L15 [Deltaproteobacteria bacterium]|nr:50S ribosomal protein L15 [Deltaproteobacteria bacterium]